jgi:hypothetical protein
VSEEPRLRPARALIGWLPPLEAGRFLAGLRPSEAERPEYQERARHARTVAAARRPDFDVRGVVTEAPQAVHEHWAAITETPIGRRLSERGRRPALVDLRRVVAVQPHVFTDTDLPELDPADPTAIAAVTLAPPGPMEVETQFDPRRNLWVIHPPSSDFRIARAHRADVEEDGLAFGLEFRFGGSFLKVYRFGDRYLLRDGTHRAVALLARGIEVVPALVGEYAPADEVHVPGGLPREAIFGRRPPLLPDYLDDAVSAAVELPATRRVILIEGLEVWVQG